MATLTVQVNPPNPGTVNVRVWVAQVPGPTFEWSGDATTEQPVDKTWNDLEPGLYAVTISWKDGYQNIASAGGPGNFIIYNGSHLYYQVLGTPKDANGILATYGLNLT